MKQKDSQLYWKMERETCETWKLPEAGVVKILLDGANVPQLERIQDDPRNGADLGPVSESLLPGTVIAILN